MRSLKTRGLLGLAVGGLILYVESPARAEAQLTEKSDMKKCIDELAVPYIAGRPHAALTIGLLRRGERYVAGFGTVAPGKKAPPDGGTSYEIGSITKLFTAITLACLEAEGLIKLNDPIARYLPREVAAPEKEGQQITLWHLATHTSGLPRLPDNLDQALKDSANPYVQYKAAHLYQFVGKAQLNRCPGSKYEYSNIGYALLGHLLALRAGASYESLVQRLICQPLGMTNTSIQWSTAQRRSLAPGHDPKGRPVPNWDFDVVAPAGAFHSTADDLLTFAAANLSREESGVSRVLRACHRRQFRNGDRAIGLGWQIQTTPEGLQVIWHNGGTGGYASFLALDSKHATAVVVLSNYGDAMAGDYSVDKIGFEVLKEAAKISP